MSDETPRSHARLIGSLSLLAVASGILRAFVPPPARDWILFLTYANSVAVMLLFYRLLRPVDRLWSLLMVIVGLVSEMTAVLAPLHLRLGTVGSLAFFGFGLLQGWLVVRSGFLPRTLGVLVMISACDSLLRLWPALAMRILLWDTIFVVVVELARILWLLIRGVDETRWRELAARAGS
jgi:hypothetical protein